jgi:tetratricopeptide (TPR) repeat protein
MLIYDKDEEYYAEIRRYSALLKAFPGNTHVLALRAGCRFRHGDWRKAAQDYERLVRLVPGDFSFWSDLGEACVQGRLPEKAVAACSRAIELEPGYGSSYMYRGWAYRQLKQWDAAIADYTKARELGLNDEGSFYHTTIYLGELYLEMGEYEKAADVYTFAISIIPEQACFYLTRGDIYLKMKQYEKVIENANVYIELNGQPDTWLLRRRAEAYMKLGQQEKAAADFARIRRWEEEEAVENEENRKEHEKWLSSQALEDEKKETEHEEEIKENEEKIKENNEKIRFLTEIIADNPKDAEAYYWRGFFYLAKQQCDYRAALHDFSKAIRMKFGRNNAYYFRANCCYNLQQYRNALRDYDKVISLEPEKIEAYRERAEIYNMLGETGKEIASLEKIHELCPGDKESVSKLGKLYEKTGRYEQAADCYTWLVLYDSGTFPLLKWGAYGRGAFVRQAYGLYYTAPEIRKLSQAIAGNSENAALYVIRGKLYDENSQFEEAVADYTKALALKPDLLIAYVYRIVANAHLYHFEWHEHKPFEKTPEYMKGIEKMIDDCLQILRVNDTLNLIYEDLSRLYLELEKYESAVAYCNKMLEIYPQYYEMYEMRATALEQVGSYQAAVDDLTFYINRDDFPFSSDLVHRGDIYFKMGAYDKAVADYSIAIEENKKYKRPLMENLEKRGRCYQALREEAKARADFTAAADIKETYCIR